MKILGTGSALPVYTLTNERLTEFLDTSDEWIRTRTGIESRRVMTTETLTQLGRDAALQAIENAGLTPGDIDFFICSTLQGDTLTPSLGCVLQHEVGLSCGAFDMNGACAGFVYALDIADAYLTSGKARRILIVCAEGMSRLVDWNDRATCVLFGDGAGAAVLEAGEGMFRSHLTSDGNAAPLNIYPLPGNSPFAVDPTPASLLHMDGQEIYKFAVSHSSADIKKLAEDSGIAVDDIGHILLHQANRRIVDAVRIRLKQPEEKFPVNVNVRGNTSSASIPILLDEQNRAGAFRKGELIAMSAFGAGLTTGACLIEWTRD